MFGFSFLDPIFLWSVAAVAIPVLIHLYYRQRYRRVKFSTVRFLRAASSRARRSLRLEELLLLFLRAMLLLLLGLALAGPVWKFTRAALLGGGGNTHAALFLDNSYSMGRLRNNRPLLVPAQEAARTVLDTLHAGDQAAVLVANDRVGVWNRKEGKWEWGKEGIGAAVFCPERAVWQAAVKAATVSWRPTDLGQALRDGYALLKPIKTANKELYLFSDMQAVGWQSLLSHKLRPEVDREVTVFLVNVGPRRHDNLAVVEVEVVEGSPVIHRDLALRATFRNFGPATQGVATLVLDGKAIRERIVPLPANGAAAATFVTRFALPGLHSGYVQLGPDALAADDRYWFAVRIKPLLPVLLVDGTHGGSALLSSVFYAKTALNPRPARPFHEAARIAPEAAGVGALMPSNLQERAAVLLANVRDLPEAAVAHLERYVREGGQVFFALGYQIDPEFYNQSLYRAGLLPAALGPVLDHPPDAPLSLGDLDVSHPLFRSFEAQYLDRLASTQFYRTVTLEMEAPKSENRKSEIENRGAEPLTPGSRTSNPEQVRVLARFSDGRPALVEKAYGRGRVLLFASALTADWNDFPLHGTYLPFLHQLVYFLSQRDDSLGRQRVGETVLLPADQGPATIQQATSDPTLRTGTRGSQAESDFAPGVYRVRFDAASRREPNFFTVNLDRTESDLTPLSVRELKKRLPEATLVYVSDLEKLPKTIEAARHGVQLQDRFLYAALALALLECLLANWFTRRRQGQVGSGPVRAGG